MASKSKTELLEQAKSQGLDVNTKTTKSELEKMLSSDNSSGQTSGNTQGVEEVTVNENRDGEATNLTTKDGQEDEVTNTESVPQNSPDKIETTHNATESAERTDANRTDEELQFADESNPNQKARNTATEGQEFDQDGNARTGGKSYGVSADDAEGTVHDERNDGEEPENPKTSDFSFLNSDVNNSEWSYEDQKSLEESLSQPDKGVMARVSTSAGSYVRVKFYFNNKPLGTFKSRKFEESEAAKYRDELVEARGL